MDLRTVSRCIAITVHLFMLCVGWVSATAEQATASPNRNLTLTETSSHGVDYCEQYYQDGQDICVTAKLCCQLGVDEYGWIAAAVGWGLWFFTLILICVNKVAKLRPDESEKYTSP
ncbi:transmembrane protein 213-like [Heptranchias perlo]|uniref:transmembrane protein 213-like n=1 Tax=Heptranchias perlo TaxID=212740 RepID=UPI003559F31A